jgi:BASS family bile acid:Na+ symporter
MFNFSKKMKRTLTIEIGMQNAGLGTVLALKYFGEKSAIPAAIFVFVCIITASFLAGIWLKRETEIN